MVDLLARTQPLGIAVVGGMFFSTFLTLVIVPVMYGDGAADVVTADTAVLVWTGLGSGALGGPADYGVRLDGPALLAVALALPLSLAVTLLVGSISRTRDRPG